MTRGRSSKRDSPEASAGRQLELTRNSLLGFILSLALLSACSLLTEPLGYDLPDPDLSLNPAALEPQNIIYGCGRWIGDPPVEEKIFVDIAFLRPDLDEEPEDRPSPRHLAALARYGGKVAYKFHFPAVRAWIATKDIPGLAGDRAVNSVFRVANLRRYDWTASVGYRGDYSYRDGAIRFAELGGRVDYQFDVINAIGGLIPDRSAAVLRQDRNVDHVASQPPFPNCS